jgi:hypothetical protein
MRACDGQPSIALAVAAARSVIERDDAGECLAAAVDAAQSRGWCVDCTPDNEMRCQLRALSVAAKLLLRGVPFDADQEGAASAASKVLSQMKTSAGWRSSLHDSCDTMGVMSDLLRAPAAMRCKSEAETAAATLQTALDECLESSATLCNSRCDGTETIRRIPDL